MLSGENVAEWHCHKQRLLTDAQRAAHTNEYKTYSVALCHCDLTAG